MKYVQQKSNYCLFCGQKGISFRRVEHIIPESIGNKTHVLHDIVCDKCNAYFSKLENYFIHHHMSSAIRLFSIGKTKKGKPPMQILQKGEARRQKDGKLTFKQSLISGKEAEQFSITFSAEDIIIKGSYPIPDADTKKLSRFLTKCGLETLYLKKGNVAFSDEFNQLRNYARYGEKLTFVPFLWQYQNERNADLLLAKITHKTKGIFYFATIFVPGCVYFVPLDRFDEIFGLDKLAKIYSLNNISKPEILKRESPRFEINLKSKKEHV